MHMWHHVTNHLITSNDKDSNSENRIKLRVRDNQQARNTARHHSHSLSGEPGTGIISRLETQQGTTATHFLESQGQALSAG
jgi:hypothetical protein